MSVAVQRLYPEYPTKQIWRDNPLIFCSFPIARNQMFGERLEIPALPIVSASNTEVEMKNFLIGAASAIALGVVGAGVPYAANVDYAPIAPEASSPGGGAQKSSQTAVEVSDKEVRLAQQQLRAQGFYTGPIDGLLDAQTKAAVKQYQSRNHLSETAVLDQATMQSLMKNTGIAGSSAPPELQGAHPPVTNPHPEARGSSKPEGATAPY